MMMKIRKIVKIVKMITIMMMMKVMTQQPILERGENRAWEEG